MAKLIALGLSLSLLVLLNGCLAYQHQFQSRQQECRLDRLQAREPDNRIEAEAGVTESWDPNDQQFQCAGVAMLRRTIEQNGLHLPSYVNAPQLIYIVRGQGVLGAVFSGCPETFEESQDEQQQQQWQPSRRIRGGQGKEQQQREDQQDRHQKIRHVRQGDVIALPAGVAYWCYNNGNEDLVAVSLIDVNNEQNQLDQLPRRFYLAGNPEDEFDQGQQGRRQHQQRQRGQQGQQQQGQRGQSQWGQQGQQGQHGQSQWGQQGQQGRRQQQGRGNNVYSGFDTQLLAQALNVDEETARNLQGQNDNRNDIVRVQGQLDFVSPLSQSSGRQQERQQEGEQRQQQQREQQRRQGGGGQNSHEQTFGLEGSFCHIRLSQNIGDPSRADFYSPNAGRITTLNSRQLPILRHLRLSAEHGVLYNNAMYSPHYNLNANELVYVIRGSARVQVVNENGESILDDEVQEGQLFLVPQNHAAIKQASNDGFEYISFKTENNAVVQTLAGRTSLLRAMPEEVLSNAYQISRQEARQLKYNRQETRVLSASQQSSRGRLSILG